MGNDSSSPKVNGSGGRRLNKSSSSSRHSYSNSPKHSSSSSSRTGRERTSSSSSRGNKSEGESSSLHNENNKIKERSRQLQAAAGNTQTSSSSSSSSSSSGTESKSLTSEERKSSNSFDPQHHQIVPYREAAAPGRNIFGSTPDDGGVNIFSTRRPRDFGAGLSSGLKNAAKGIGLGAAALVAAPAYGASQEGVGGFFKGLGAGVVMALVLPVAGVGMGISQVARGAFNTPEAVMEKHAGKKWDKKKREWKENWYSLDEEKAEIANLNFAFSEQKKIISEASEGRRHSEGRSTGNGDGRSVDVADREYYDMLDVEPTASAAEIRKSYYKLARDCHPDKNRDDPTAHQKFQALGEAYQVLGDEKRRSDYDKKGKSAADNMPIIDSSLFFTMLFGSEALEPFVGKLKMATFVENFETNSEISGKLTEAIMEFEQRKREVDLAVKLRDRLEGFCNGSSQQRKTWCDEMAKKAREMCKNAFGDTMVEAVGWTYENYGCQFLGKLDTFLGYGGKIAKFQAKNRELGNVMRVAGVAVKASIAANKLAKAEEKKEKSAKLREERNKEKTEDKEDSNSSRTTAAEHAATPKAAFDESSSNKNAAAQRIKPEQDEAAAAETQNDEETNSEWTMPTEEEKKANLENAKQFEHTLPLILDTMLNVCLIDIESTVRNAAKKVLKDLATPVDIRRQRAEGLIELGKIFQKEAEQVKSEHKGAPLDYMRCMEEAFIRLAREADREAHQKDDPPTGEGL